MWQEKVTAAHDAISQYISETPLEYSVSLSAASKSSVYLKVCLKARTKYSIL